MSSSMRRSSSVVALFVLLACAAIASPAHAIGPCDSDTPPDSCFDTFEETQAQSLSVTNATAAAVTSSPSGINCGADCSQNYNATRTCDGFGCEDWVYPSVTLTSGTPPVGYQASWSGCDSTTSTTCTLTMEGPKTVSLGWHDVQAPSLTFAQPGKRGPSAASVTASATDNSGAVPTYNWTVDGAEQSSHGSALSVLSLSAGSHSISVRAVDNSNNQSDAVTHDVVVDKSVSLTAGTLQAVTNAATVPLSFSTDSDVPTDDSHRQCRLGGDAFGPCTSSTSFSPIDATSTDGTYTYEVKVTDDVGNVASVTRTSKLDRTKPAIAITGGPAEGEQLAVGAASFTFSVTDDNFGGTVCIVDDGLPAACTSATTEDLSGLGDGSHSLTISSTDQAGNVRVVTRHFTVALPKQEPPPVGGQTGGDGGETGTGTGSVTQPEAIAAKVSFKVKRHGATTSFTKLVLSGVPAGATVKVACAGKGCPKKPTLKSLRKRALRPGTKLTLTISKPGATTQVIVVTVRKGKKPLVKT